MRSEQAAAGDGLLGERLFVSGNRIRRAGDDAHRGIVDGGERKFLGQRDFGGGKRHGQHRSLGQIVDHPSTRSDDRERIFERKDAGDAGADVFANTVAGHGSGLNAKRSPPLGERVFDREERGLCEPRLIQTIRTGILFGIRRIKRRNQIDAQRLAQMLRAKIESFAENRFVLIELATHVHVLRALAGKQKHRRGTSRGSGNEPFAIETGERGNGLSHVFDDDGAAVRKCRAPQLASESNVGKIQFRMLCKMRGKICKGLIGGAFGLCGNRENFVRLLVAGEQDGGRLFHDHVRIGAADAERSDARAARRCSRKPIGELAVYVKRTASKLDVRIDLLEMQAGGNLRVLQRKHGLDEASNAGRCI